MRLNSLTNAVRQSFAFAADYAVTLAAARWLWSWHTYPRVFIGGGLQRPAKASDGDCTMLCVGCCIAGSNCPHYSATRQQIHNWARAKVIDMVAPELALTGAQ
jgi:hypothetical protein